MCCKAYLVAEFNALKWATNKAFIKRDLVFVHAQALAKLLTAQNKAVPKVKKKVSPSIWLRKYAPSRKPPNKLHKIQTRMLIAFIVGPLKLGYKTHKKERQKHKIKQSNRLAFSC